MPTRLAPYVEHLVARCTAGEHDAAALVAEIRARGYAGSTLAAKRLVSRLVHTDPRAPRGAGKPPSARQVSSLLFHGDAELATADRASVADLCERCPPLADARRLAHEFRAMLAE